MKIAQIICQFRPYKSGMSEVAYNFSKELTKLGNEVVVFTPLYDKNLIKIEKLDGFVIKRIKPLLKYGNAAFIPSILKELNNFDIVHLHYPFFGVAEIVWLNKIFKKNFTFNAGKLGAGSQRRINQIKLVITYHMDVVGKGILGKFFEFYSNFLMPGILKSADLITVSSLDYFKNSAAYDEELAKKIIELPFGVDKNIYKPAHPDKNFFAKYNLEEDDKIILFVSSLDKAHYFKGAEYLIKAFKLLYNTKVGEIYSVSLPDKEECVYQKQKLKLVIIGEGDLKPYYKNLAEQLGLKNQIIFAGRADDKEKIKFLNACYMKILPSIDKSEAFGIVLLEAMACGKPVIASNLPGVRSIVEDGVNGLLCEPKNEEKLAGKIKYLLDNSLIARQMGGNGLAKIEDMYNWNKIGKRLEYIYKNI
ncbi:MAG: glycosyltransferase family 4 protein [bacterium]